MAWNEKIKKKLKYCGEDVYIGKNTYIAFPEEVMLFDRVRIDPFCLITTRLTVESNSHICSHAVIGGGKDQLVLLRGWNFIGYGSKLFTASEDYSGECGPVCEFWGSNKVFRGDIIFEKFSGVASDVIVFPSVKLPEGCAIGAKSLVHTSRVDRLEEYTVYVGDNLKPFKKRNKENILLLSEDREWLKKI